MQRDKLAYMANQIATFFQSSPEGARSDGVADHINMFWEPRMRRELLARFDEQGPDGMHELVVAALQDKRAELEPAASA